ncbi:hypothetical protein BSL78_16704 [Apostichopus japonicus]|uniref:RNA-directed DNA polymerase from mobile element jockey-like n=1 Tax=Stichopus japonicus TaxID=307972 RepID=A0A2G8KEI1_STIJA|nr:hypothetical protein BSL78_16704 [Apostichopus japonicus]
MPNLSLELELESPTKGSRGGTSFSIYALSNLIKERCDASLNRRHKRALAASSRRHQERPLKFYKLAFIYLLLMAGDIHTNPGPNYKFPCGLCSKPVRINQRGIQCDNCNIWYHIKCTDVSVATYDRLSGTDEDWLCNQCQVPFQFADSFFDSDQSLSDTSLDSTSTDTATSTNITNGNPFDIDLPRGLKICHLNIQGIRSSYDTLKLSMASKPFDVITLSETNLNDSVPDESITLPGFTCERKDGTTSKSHGIATFISNTLVGRRRLDLEVDHLDCLWTEIILPKTRPILIGSVYRSPNSDFVYLNDILNNISNALDCNYETLILGDFNLDLLPTCKKGLTKDMHDYTRRNELSQMISEPTRVTLHSRTLLDHIYVNRKNYVTQSGVIPTGLSDHRLIYAVRRANKPKHIPRKITTRSFKRFHQEAFIDDISKIPFSCIEGLDDIDLMWYTWKTLFNEVSDAHAPLKTVTVKGEHTPWVTDEFISMTWERDHLKKVAEKHGSLDTWARYKKCRNKLNNLASQLKCFRPGYSTTTALSYVVDDILSNMDGACGRKNYTGILFLDFKKAFDTVDHDILLDKLRSYGVVDSALDWFGSYLAGRYQIVQIENQYSDMMGIAFGVPQGSIIGPLLFSIYINDLPSATSESQAILYADDTAVIYSSEKISEIQQVLSTDLILIGKWLVKNKLTLNVKKTKSMLFGTPTMMKRADPLILHYDSHDIEQVHVFRYLGVLLDSTLTFKDHLSMICKKISCRLGILGRVKKYLPHKYRIMVYTI